MKKLNLNSLVRPNIMNLKPYSSARDEYHGSYDSIYLDANENPLPENYNRYPDPHQVALKQKLSEIKDVDPERIFIGNGSDEAIDLLIRVFCAPGSDRVLIMDPTYGMYRVCADINDVEVEKLPLTKSFQLKADEIISLAEDPLKSVKLIFLCSPGNPSGVSLDPGDVIQILENVNIPVVIDEAYIDFTNHESWSKKLDQFENLIILQTFSKAFGLAGLRLGMAFASFEIISLLDKTKPPYNINEYSQIKGFEVLENYTQIEKWNTELVRERSFLEKELPNLNCVFEVLPSETNFLLVRFNNSSSIFEYLTQNKIIVRDRSRQLHCEDCLRITVGSRKENESLINTLKEYEKESALY